MAALIAQYLPRILTLIDYYRAPAPKARNIIARGKREAQRNASPLDPKSNLKRALKVRNINVNYSALSELHDHCARLPGATRLTLFGACPWLSYFAPSALPHSRCPWLSYFAPSALPHSRCPWLFIFRAFGVLAVCVGVGALSLGLLRLLFANNDGEEAQKQGIRDGIQEMTI